MLDLKPDRELVEEFEDSLDVTIGPASYHLTSHAMVIEDMPVATQNVRAEGTPTSRIYFVYEACIEDVELIARMQANSTRISDAQLENLAWEDARQGGKGRANAVLVTYLDDLLSAYRSIPTDRRGERISFDGHELGGNVLTILHEIDQVRYRR